MLVKGLSPLAETKPLVEFLMVAGPVVKDVMFGLEPGICLVTFKAPPGNYISYIPFNISDPLILWLFANASLVVK